MKMIKLMLTVCCVVATSAAFAYERLQGPTELLYWDKTNAFNGYTLFASHGTTYLIDMSGQVTHIWRLGTNPRFLDNGNLLDASKDDPSGFQGFVEVDWDGNKIWEYAEKREGYAPHHDWVRVFNKKLNAPTTMYIANKSISHDQAIAAGADPRKGPYDEGQMDAVVEVDMKGNVVWEWWFFDHVVQDIDPAKPNHVGKGKTVADYPNRININMPGRPLKRDWLHCNSMDYSAESGHIVINSVQGELYVIDHDGTFVAGDPKAGIAKAAGPAGDFLYRFGDPARYGQGDPPRVLENWDNATTGHKQMGGAHDVHWIRPGLPGAGHIMVFNNGQYLFQRTPQSSIIEINPFLDGSGHDTGKYVNPPDAGYVREEYDHDTHNSPRQISRHVVWIYRSINNHGFFSQIGSSGQRLPNGNTLICSDTEGHFFEVTAAGKLVWEYINPVTKEFGTVKTLPDALPMMNSAFRAYRYAADHPALKGRDLKPLGMITDAFPRQPDPRAKDRPGPRQGARKRGKGAGQGKDDGGDRGRGGGRGDRDGGVSAPPKDEKRADADGAATRDDERHRPTEARVAAASLVAPGATVKELAGGFQFAEGPTADAQGSLFFSDLAASKIHRWSAEGKLSTYRSDTGGANGLFFDDRGNLIACEGDRGRLVSIDPRGQVTVLASEFNGRRFNKPNDLWIAPSGGIYFSDPAYGTRPIQDGEHVYYLPPDRGRVVRVIDDLVRPNGLVGAIDGKILYVSDHGIRRIYAYDISPDGSLSNKRFFAPVGADGMTLDRGGNVYLAEDAVLVYDRSGRRLGAIEVPERPTNLCFGGKDGQTLFITTRPALYAVQMLVPGTLKSRQSK